MELADAPTINVDSIRYRINGPSTLYFTQLEKYDAAGLIEPGIPVTYTSDGGETIFRGHVQARVRHGETERERVEYVAVDAAGALDRHPLRIGSSTRIAFNAGLLEGGLTVNRILSMIASAAVSAGHVDGYSVPACSVVPPEIAMNGGTYTTWIGAVLMHAPNWSYRIRLATSGSVATTRLEFFSLSAGTSKTVAIGTGDDRADGVPDVVALAPEENVAYAYKYYTIEGRADYREYHRASHLAPAWSASAVSAEVDCLFEATYPISNLYYAGNYTDDPAKKFRPAYPVIYYISGSTVVAWGILKKWEGRRFYTRLFAVRGLAYTSVNASNYRISYTAIVGPLEVTVSSSSSALDGEYVDRDNRFFRYTDRSGTVVRDDTSAMAALAGTMHGRFDVPAKIGSVNVYAAGVSGWELGDRVENLDGRTVVGMTFFPVERELRLDLANIREAARMFRPGYVEERRLTEGAALGRFVSGKEQDPFVDPEDGGFVEPDHDEELGRDEELAPKSDLVKIKAAIDVAQTGLVRYSDVDGTECGPEFAAKNMGPAEAANDDFAHIGYDCNGAPFFFMKGDAAGGNVFEIDLSVSGSLSGYENRTFYSDYAAFDAVALASIDLVVIREKIALTAVPEGYCTIRCGLELYDGETLRATLLLNSAWASRNWRLYADDWGGGGAGSVNRCRLKCAMTGGLSLVSAEAFCQTSHLALLTLGGVDSYRWDQISWS